MRRTRTLFYSLLIVALLVGAVPVLAASPVFPETISLPNGFNPEGIVSGYGTDFYAGSLADGSIYKGNYRTGQGAILVVGPGAPAVGLSFDERTGFLFVSGGPLGTARVYDTRTGAQVGFFQLAPSAPTFVNDVVVTQGAAFFTDSMQSVLYRVPLSPGGGLPEPSQVETLPLSGDFTLAPGFNANGIEATSAGNALILVQSNLGVLYRVDPLTGEANLIDLGGASVGNGDGILLRGFTLYVLRNFFNQIAVIELSPDLSSGSLVRTITHPDFDIPTTLAGFGSRLYAVNARFSTPVTPDKEYDIIQVKK
jgi:hypothetical protein